jgi:hypothetical protein
MRFWRPSTKLSAMEPLYVTSSSSSSSPSPPLTAPAFDGEEGVSGDPKRVREGSLLSDSRRKRWLLCSRVSLAVLYVLLVILACIVVWQLVARGSERHVIAWAVGAMAVGIAVPLSLHDVQLHLLHYVSPLQRLSIRILLMIPIYSIQSWLALRFKDEAIFLELGREAYEAYVIYAFFKFMSEYIGPAAVSTLKANGHEHVHLVPPFKWCMRPWRAEDLPRKSSVLVFQYVFLRTLLAVAAFIAELAGTYGEGEWENPGKLFVWNVVILNISQVCAMLGLVTYFHAFQNELKPVKAFPKLLVIKGVVFFSFYQQIVIAGLVHVNVIGETLTYTKEEVADGLQNFLIVLEMVAAAVAHRYYFSYADFAHLHSDLPAMSLGKAVVDVLPGDVLADAAHHLGGALSAVDPSKLRFALLTSKNGGGKEEGGGNGGRHSPSDSGAVAGAVGAASSSLPPTTGIAAPSDAATAHAWGTLTPPEVAEEAEGADAPAVRQWA